MFLGVIADDFTGASDIANTLAKGVPGQGGFATSQYMGIPTKPARPEVEAGVVSLKSRTIPVAEAVSQSLAALDWLQAQGCRQIVFKYCSTFDSTKEGNIGPVCEALADRIGTKGVVVCPVFPGAGRTLYQGHLFVKDRLLNESGMQHHPLTPMTDSDIRRWLEYQTTTTVGLIALPSVRRGSAAVRAALQAGAAQGQTLMVVDAVLDEDLLVIGEACAEAALVTGGSGIALGLTANFVAQGIAKGDAGTFAGRSGPGAILAGSCSGATWEQIQVHGKGHPLQAIDVESVLSGATTATDLVGFINEHQGKAPLVYSSGTPETVAATQARYGRERVAMALDELFAATARDLVEGGLKRLVVAGGETSGAVAQALDLGDLLVGPEIDPGVPVLVSQDKDLAIALKSGNFGGPDFFAKALEAMEEGRS